MDSDYTEIATVTMTITTMNGFEKAHIGKLLKKITEGYRSFYLKVKSTLEEEL